VDRITKTIKLYPGVFKGIGEVMSRHDDLTNLTTDDRPRPIIRRSGASTTSPVFTACR
jgi:hypothetical protein